MAEKKYVGTEALARLIAQLKAGFAPINHTHDSIPEHEHVLEDIIDYAVDDIMSDTSTNPVQNNVICSALSSNFDALKAYTDEEVAKITSGTTVIKEAEQAWTANRANNATNANHAEEADNAKHAETADSATKATQDASGNVITSHYETKADASAKLAEAKSYADGIVSGKADSANSLAGYGIEDAYDKPTIDSLLSGKADASALTNGSIKVAEAVSSDTSKSCTGNAATATRATSADSAIKATQDGDGNVITDTYETKANASAKYDELSASIGNHRHDASVVGFSDKNTTYATGTNVQSAVEKLDVKVEELNSDVSQKANSSTTLSGYGIEDAYTKEEINSKVSSINSSIDGKENTGVASNLVSSHNTSESAHNDIRDSVKDLTKKVTDFLNVSDEDFDTLSELIEYIEANRESIESFTTNKVNVADIVDNLTTNVSNKPLSAAQGVVINNLIDSIQDEIDANEDNISTHVSKVDNPHGVTASQVGAYTKSETDTAISTAVSGKANSSDLNSHINDKTSNPHGVTAAQVGAYTKEEVNNALAGKQAAGNYSLVGHDHNDEYYTEEEIDAKIQTINTSIDGKAPSSHNHAISEVTNLQSTLDGKAAKTHTHTISDIEELEERLASIEAMLIAITDADINSICGASIVAATYDAANEVMF